jgi:hypothetical protein
MAKKKKEEPIVDNEVGSLKVKAKKEKQPDGNETKGNVTKVKEKMTMKPMVEKETITKVDLNKPSKEETDAVQEPETNASDAIIGKSEDSEGSEKVVEEVRDTKENEDTVQNEETPVLEEVTEEKVEEQVEEIAEEASEAIKENLETGKPLPENIQKLMDFMEETGGDLNDYVKLNQDYSELDNHTLLKEYYRSTKPHLSEEEIDFVMEDTFSYDEDADEEKHIKRKKLAMKEQVAQARQHLDSVKSKYYEDIKSGSKLTSEQQKAIDFFNRYNEKSESDKKTLEKNTSTFLNKTDKVFNDKFKGFEYNVGDKKYRFNVNDVDGVKKTQSDINNFVGKFLDKNNVMEDAEGYHKSLYTAMNSDAVARHFYEQGKADALRDSVAKSKNIDMDPRQQLSNNIADGSGIKVRALGENTEDFKFKIKNKFKK